MADLKNNVIEETLKNTKTKLITDIKKSIYDWVAAGIVVAIIAASLDAIGLVDFTQESYWRELADFAIRWIPYFMAAILLSDDLYKKGVFVGKHTKIYMDTATAYNQLTNGLSGEQIKAMYPFCIEYNNKAVKDMQEQILRSEGLTYEDFNEKFTYITYKEDGTEKKVTKKKLLLWTNKELKESGCLTKNQIKAVKAAKKVTVRGINVNILLSSINIDDPTNIGETEENLAKKQQRSSIIKWFFGTFFMSLIAIKDITQWGWAGLIIVIFKVAYVFGRSYMAYFRGYNDITIKVVNHLGRKTDIIKMFLKYVPEPIVEEVEEVEKTVVIPEPIAENRLPVIISQQNEQKVNQFM